MRHHRVGALLCGIIVVAGCGGGGQDSQPAVVPAPSGARTASIAQYASLVAKNKALLGRTVGTLTGAKCDLTTPGEVDVQFGSFVCATAVLDVGTEAEALATELNDAGKLDTPGYLGAPPPEVSRLVADTITAGQKVTRTSARAKECIVDSGKGCAMILVDFKSAVRILDGQLAAWAPYGVP